MSNESLTIKQRLAIAGYEVKRIENDGKFCGVEILKDGIRAHKTPLASVELAIEICEREGV